MTTTKVWKQMGNMSASMDFTNKKDQDGTTQNLSKDYKK
jgi:hypothetical protein